MAAAEAFLRVSSDASMPGFRPRSLPSPQFSSAVGTLQVAGKVPAALNNKLGIAIAKRTYKAYRDLLGSARCSGSITPRPSAAPAVGEHGNQGSKASDVLYIKALAAPFTVNTMPEGTLKALADHGRS